MRILTSVVILAAVTAAAGGALAGPVKRISDSDYLKANRCLGLASATELGAPNPDPFKALVKAQSVGRNEVIASRGKTILGKSLKEPRNSNEERRAVLRSELEGSCAALLG